MSSSVSIARTGQVRNRLVCSGTALAAKERHDSRVHLIAPFPSLAHCSQVPRSHGGVRGRRAAPTIFRSEMRFATGADTDRPIRRRPLKLFPKHRGELPKICSPAPEASYYFGDQCWTLSYKPLVKVILNNQLLRPFEHRSIKNIV